MIRAITRREAAPGISSVRLFQTNKANKPYDWALVSLKIGQITAIKKFFQTLLYWVREALTMWARWFFPPKRRFITQRATLSHREELIYVVPILSRSRDHGIS